MSNIFENKGALATTILVAASDSLNRAAANYVCDGVADQVEIQAAHDALPATGGCVVLLEGSFNVTNLTLSKGTVKGQGTSTLINLTGSITLQSTGAGQSVCGRIQSLRILTNNYVGDALVIDGLARPFHFNEYIYDDIQIENTGVKGGTAILLNSEQAAGPGPVVGIMYNTFGDINISNFAYAMRLRVKELADYGACIMGNVFHAIHIWVCNYGIEGQHIGGFIGQIAGNKFLSVHIENAATQVRGIYLPDDMSANYFNVRVDDWTVGTALEIATGAQRNHIVGSLSGSVINPEPSNIIIDSQDKTRGFLPENVMTCNWIHLPVNAGWTPSHVNGGQSSEPFRQYVYTSVTASSRGLVSCQAFGLSGWAGNASYVNWDKKLIIVFGYARTTADVQAIARVQLKEVATEGALAAKGVGIRVENYTLYGESYGVALGSVDLGTILTSYSDVLIAIVLYPGSKIEWYVNGVLKGVQNTANTIPTGIAVGVSCFVHSIINGVAGGNNCYSNIMQVKIWQGI